MLSHETVWAAIDALAARNGLSPSGLARRAGLDPTSFNPSKRHAGDGRPRWPSTESLAKILNATNETLETFAYRFGNPDSGSNRAPALTVGRLFDDRNQRLGSGLTEYDLPDIAMPGAFAMRVTGKAFLPHYRDGDILVASRDAVIRQGDRLVLKPQADTPSLFELRARTHARAEAQFNRGQARLGEL
ncbi:helix-turn-helix transcriptional regulator [Roseibium sediminicola]|uniref:Helix-turn-helix transcriptional regulator n=1 Tax=Roseibium sediminicola TaxID=2933272 RepID=A0ABT0GQ42_9HYPH|nr:helix-turn-helix transcriptional regulator [Roseibium sp. CAU 1639]MCK7610963.1 helix-turn-helix transcriptional regulator [Roseibium sp. CAU 1639]